MTASRRHAWVGALAALMAAAVLSASTPIAVAEQLRRGPAPGSGARAFARSMVEGAVRVERGWAVPLRAERPGWLAPRLLRRVHSARGRPVAVPDRVPAAATIETGIRPGSLMVSPHRCTMNFIFRRPGGFAIGTAGHCVDRVDQPVVLEVLAPGSGGVVLVSVGRVVMRALSQRRSAPDFALVRVRDRLESWVRAPITSIGGPCGIFRGDGLRSLWHYGYPLGLVGAERFGYSLFWGNVRYSWVGTAASGDSGSPVRTGGYGAAGNLTHVGYSLGPDPGTVFGTRMTWIEDFVAPWRLVSSPGCA